jgi:hypothetical protein
LRVYFASIAVELFPAICRQEKGIESKRTLKVHARFAKKSISDILVVVQFDVILSKRILRGEGSGRAKCRVLCDTLIAPLARFPAKNCTTTGIFQYLPRAGRRFYNLTNWLIN